MSRIIHATLVALIMCTIICIGGACGRKDETKNAAAVKQYVMAQLKNDTASYIRAYYAHIDSIDLKSDEDCILLYRAFNNLAIDIKNRGDNPRTMKMLRHVLDILKNSDELTHTDSRQLINLYVSLGATFKEQGMPSIGLDYYMTGLESCKDTTLDTYKAMLYNNIGVLYAEGNILDKAEQYFNKALEINLRKSVHHEAFLNYANLTELYTIRGRDEEAMKASQRSLDHIDESKFPAQLAGMRLQQALLYTKKEQYDVAMLRYASALGQYKELNDIPGVIKTHLQICDTYLTREMPDSALAYASEALQMARRADRDEDVKNTLKTLSRIREARGEHDLALSLLHESTQLEDSLRNVESQLRLNNWEVLGSDMFNTPVGKEKEARLEPWVIAVMAILFLGLVAMFIMYMRRRHEYAESEQRSRELTRDYTKTLDKRNREMTTLSLEKIKTHEGLVGVCDELRAVLLELNPKETAKRDRIRALLGRLESMTEVSADDEFKHFFELVHPDLYKTLSEKHPDLTARDQRLCAFLHLGLTTKEIAAMTYREVRSVESARNRLRKKIGLELSDDLTGYLRSLSD